MDISWTVDPILRIFFQQVIFSQSLNGELVSFAKNANLGLFWAKKLSTNQIAQFFKSQYLVNHFSDLANFSKQVRYPWFLSNKKVFLGPTFFLTPKFAIFDFWDNLNAIFLDFFAFCLLKFD